MSIDYMHMYVYTMYKIAFFFLILLSNDSKREHNVMGHGPQNFQVNNKSKKLNT